MRFENGQSPGLAAFDPVEFSECNPWRPEDWRSRRAASEICRGGDRWVKRLKRFRYSDEDPAYDAVLFEAHRIHRSRWLRGEVQARILAGQDLKTIAQMVNVSRDSLIAYELIFFDVRSRLTCDSWIRSQILHTTLGGALGWNDVELLWNRIAYRFGGMSLDHLFRAASRPDLHQFGLDAYLRWETSLPLPLRGLILVARMEIPSELTCIRKLGTLLRRLDLLDPERTDDQSEAVGEEEVLPIRDSSEWGSTLTEARAWIRDLQLAI